MVISAISIVSFTPGIVALQAAKNWVINLEFTAMRSDANSPADVLSALN